ncbi:hypothetical protein YQE_07268, partial [Dendroctonus ponderosae]
MKSVKPASISMELHCFMAEFSTPKPKSTCIFSASEYSSDWPQFHFQIQLSTFKLIIPLLLFSKSPLVQSRPTIQLFLCLLPL